MLKKFLPACFGGTKPKSQGINRIRTAEYETHIGRVILTWAHVITGLQLTMEIFISGHDNRAGRRVLSQQIELSKEGKHGLRKFRVKPYINEPVRRIEVGWDVTRARFKTRRDAQPNENYYLGIACEGEMIILEGDMREDAYKDLKVVNRGYGSVYVPVKREDTVDLKGRSYGTSVHLGGKDRDISITIQPGKYAPMNVSMDGKNLVELSSLWSEEQGSSEFHTRDEETIRVAWRRQGWNPAMTKKNRSRFAPEREAGGVVLPKVVVGISSTKFGMYSEVYFRLNSS